MDSRCGRLRSPHNAPQCALDLRRPPSLVARSSPSRTFAGLVLPDPALPATSIRTTACTSIPADPTTLCDIAVSASACPAADIAGHFISLAQPVLSVGASIAFRDPVATPAPIPSGPGFAAVYAAGAALPQIIGFGYVTVTKSGDPGYSCPVGSLFQILGTPPGIAPVNAAAVPMDSSAAPVSLPGALLAPAIVR